MSLHTWTWRDDAGVDAYASGGSNMLVAMSVVVSSILVHDPTYPMFVVDLPFPIFEAVTTWGSVFGCDFAGIDRSCW